MKSKTIFFKEKTLSKWFKFPQRYWPASLELTDLHKVWNWWTTVLIEYVKEKKKPKIILFGILSLWKWPLGLPTLFTPGYESLLQF